MVTTVGLQNNFIDALLELVQLDYDAAAAYEAAINRIDREDYKDVLKNFKKDHENHIKVLSEYLETKGEIPPEGPGLKSLLTQGKVVLADLVGATTVLRALRSNEEDTNTAYERLNNYEAIPEEIGRALENGLEDERRHAAWLDKTLEEE
ncbi:MAG: ferritin-like domain-containing protein [Alphaproteobacteria bacterium]|nr:ferritin-like domain-containing protein [Alphaproteobacteria bacterium]